MFSSRTSYLARLALRNFRHSLPLTKTMPFTELALPKLKAGPEVKAAFAAQRPTSAKILASQPTIIRAFFGSVIRENEISTEEENKPIIVIEWTEEAAFNFFLTSEDFAAFIGPIKPLADGPAEIQVFDTDVGLLGVVSAPLTEIIRIQLKDDAESAVVTKDAWTVLVKAQGSAVPVTSGTSLNLKDGVFMGTIGWKSLEVRASTLEASPARTALSKLRDVGEFSSILIKVEPFKTASKWEGMPRSKLIVHL
ncbi:hypothetical protein POJ06DRAFT_253748 [Lipomyces tetrasporus]|uniref:Uncharacterized protein n=1 Tax=Lipomyces tetrasporus TaxID=54092 RepID=A0AAD7QST1_9ASCO|nr:uncharacterized protein POJ06DRAFT_253748 [Lipomyces tetrasporus]KAJ8100813.1 hypothetical protein POJ06DRAFT_253748 [Lipomyces tetrasporus]